MLDFSEEKILEVKDRAGVGHKFVRNFIPYAKLGKWTKDYNELSNRHTAWNVKDPDMINPDENGITSAEKKARQAEKKSILEDRKKYPKIESDEYVIGILGMLIKDFNKDDFKDFEVNDITLIMSKLKEMEDSRTEEDKKKV
jgi:hypothetical protein